MHVTNPARAAGVRQQFAGDDGSEKSPRTETRSDSMPSLLEITALGINICVNALYEMLSKL